MAKKIIAFHSEDVDFLPGNIPEMTSWLLNVADSEKTTLRSIDYIFCSDNFLLEINRDYLGHDYFTDIITFPLKQKPVEANVFISIDRVRENAQLYSNSFEDELHRVILHGLLHLIGYDDKNPEDEKKMRGRENHYLDKRTFI